MITPDKMPEPDHFVDGNKMPEPGLLPLPDADSFTIPPGSPYKVWRHSPDSLKAWALRCVSANTEALRERVRVLEAAQAWQPIETAPRAELFRDGMHAYAKYILAWWPGATAPVRARWWQSDNGGSNFLADGGYAVLPTVWPPLPAPPPSGG